MKTVGFVCLVLAMGCKTIVDPAPESASMRFQIDAPFCGNSPFSIQFSIDQVIVGTETLHNGLASQLYPTTAGSHRLTASLSGRATVQDTTVTVPGGKVFTDTVGVYCS